MRDRDELGMGLTAVRLYGRVRHVIGPRDARADKAEKKAIRRYQRRARLDRFFYSRWPDRAMYGLGVALLVWTLIEWIR